MEEEALVFSLFAEKERRKKEMEKKKERKWQREIKVGGRHLRSTLSANLKCTIQCYNYGHHAVR